MVVDGSEWKGRNARERRASLEKDDAQADPRPLGKADTGVNSEVIRPAAAPGGFFMWVLAAMYTRNVRNTGSPERRSRLTKNRTHGRDRRAPRAWRRGPQ